MEFDFEIKYVYGMCQVFQGHFFVWVAFDTDQRLLILKSVFSLNLSQVLQGCLIFRGLDMFFLVTCL